MNKEEIDDIIRAYMNAINTGKFDMDTHKRVTQILNKYDEYAYYYLTHEERNGDD